MKVQIEPGMYVVAVSGGVDSIVLLDLLCRQSNLKLVVAHFDHGIREASGKDRQFVQRLSEQYALPFVYDEGKLGPRASEAQARAARYEFLKHVRRASNAQAIMTAHHQDDVLETIILNILRGTNRKGLSSLASSAGMIRPLLGYKKSELVTYAKEHQLSWHEDETNTNEAYLRNYVRHHILPRFSVEDKERLLVIAHESHPTNAHIDEVTGDLLKKISHEDMLERHAFIMLPHSIAREVMATWLRLHGVREFDARTIERAVHGSKTLQAGKQVAILSGVHLHIGKTQLALKHTER
jgi:tRNA(Ile)-lysidine synthase